MTSKQKTTKSAKTAPAEIGDEALDRVAGGTGFFRYFGDSDGDRSVKVTSVLSGK